MRCCQPTPKLRKAAERCQRLIQQSIVHALSPLAVAGHHEHCAGTVQPAEHDRPASFIEAVTGSSMRPEQRPPPD